MIRFAFLFVGLSLALVGCSNTSSSEVKKTEPQPIAKAGSNTEADGLEKLSPEDRTLAKAQKLCPISEEELGSMGTPIKLTIKDQAVFICCKSCQKKAEANADETLKKLAQLKEKK